MLLFEKVKDVWILAQWSYLAIGKWKKNGWSYKSGRPVILRSLFDGHWPWIKCIDAQFEDIGPHILRILVQIEHINTQFKDISQEWSVFVHKQSGTTGYQKLGTIEYFWGLLLFV